jgi:MFS superfamily sulfate permease-like transporter
LASLPLRLLCSFKVIFDLSDANLIDHTVMEFIDRFRIDYQANGGNCEIHGLTHHETLGDHPLATRITKR